MIVVAHGPVTEQHLAEAKMFYEIAPTLVLTNGEGTRLPGGTPVEFVRPCEKLPGETGLYQSHWRMLLRADAVICVGRNEHLVGAAHSYGLPVYES